jgi:hypothetical protein
MNRIVLALVLAGGVALAAGCSSDGKKSDPKPASSIDPRLKPAESGGGQPQGSKGQGAVKGD